MQKHDIPALMTDIDLPVRTAEIRLPERSTGHEARNAEEARL